MEVWWWRGGELSVEVLLMLMFSLPVCLLQSEKWADPGDRSK